MMEFALLYRSDGPNLLGDQAKLIRAFSAVLPSSKPSLPPLGKPTVKERFYIMDASVVGLSLICSRPWNHCSG